jgi:hypothetical protein
MKLNKNLLLSFFFIALALFSCKKEQPISDIDLLRNGRNEDVYPTTKLDSAQAIASITQQKLQELYDISALYSSGNKNTAIDTLNYNQIQGYFMKKDSGNVKNLLKELDSLQVKHVKVKNLEIASEIKGKDTTDYALYTVEYKNKDQRTLGEFNKKSQYKLLKSPVNFKKEFKFYFVQMDVKPKDSTSTGVTK